MSNIIRFAKKRKILYISARHGKRNIKSSSAKLTKNRFLLWNSVGNGVRSSLQVNILCRVPIKTGRIGQKLSRLLLRHKSRLLRLSGLSGQSKHGPSSGGGNSGPRCSSGPGPNGQIPVKNRGSSGLLPPAFRQKGSRIFVVIWGQSLRPHLRLLLRSSTPNHVNSSSIENIRSHGLRLRGGLGRQGRCVRNIYCKFQIKIFPWNFFMEF